MFEIVSSSEGGNLGSSAFLRVLPSRTLLAHGTENILYEGEELVGRVRFQGCFRGKIQVTRVVVRTGQRFAKVRVDGRARHRLHALQLARRGHVDVLRPTKKKTNKSAPIRGSRTRRTHLDPVINDADGQDDDEEVGRGVADDDDGREHLPKRRNKKDNQSESGPLDCAEAEGAGPRGGGGARGRGLSRRPNS